MIVTATRHAARVGRAGQRVESVWQHTRVAAPARRPTRRGRGHRPASFAVALGVGIDPGHNGVSEASFDFNVARWPAAELRAPMVRS